MMGSRIISRPTRETQKTKKTESNVLNQFTVREVVGHREPRETPTVVGLHFQSEALAVT